MFLNHNTEHVMREWMKKYAPPQKKCETVVIVLFTSKPPFAMAMNSGYDGK